MGLYINTGNGGFRSARNGEYVDKSLLIDVVNASLNSERQFMCVSRARRFGKSMAARMLNAYYDHSCRSEALFADLKIAAKPSFKENLNRFPVLFVDMTNFITRYRNRDDIVEHIEHDLVAELESAYPDVRHNTQGELLPLLNDIVAQAIDRIHSDNTSILQYNDENSLACVLSIAYYAARNKYAIVREMPTGKGFADLVLVPRRGVDMPALVLELKYDHDARTALNQIQAKHYTDSLVDYVGEVVLVGINYDKKTKRHQCVIGRIEKSGTSDKISDKFPINAEISDKTSDKFSINAEISDKFPIKSRISDKLAAIVEYMEAHQGTITQVEVAAMFGVSDRQARNYLNLLIAQGKVEPLGANKNRVYKLLTC